MVFEQGSEPWVWENCGHPGPEGLNDLSNRFSPRKLGVPPGFSFQGRGCHPRKEVTRAQHPAGLGLGGEPSSPRENVEKEDDIPAFQVIRVRDFS